MIGTLVKAVHAILQVVIIQQGSPAFASLVSSVSRARRPFHAMVPCSYLCFSSCLRKSAFHFSKASLTSFLFSIFPIQRIKASSSSGTKKLESRLSVVSKSADFLVMCTLRTQMMAVDVNMRASLPPYRKRSHTRS